MVKMVVTQVDLKKESAWDVLTEPNVYIVHMTKPGGAGGGRSMDSHPYGQALSFKLLSNPAIKASFEALKTGEAAIVRVTFEEEP